MLIDIYGDMKDIEATESGMICDGVDVIVGNVTFALTRDQAETLYERLDEQLNDETGQELQNKLDDLEADYEQLKSEYVQLQELYVAHQQNARQIA